MTSQADEFSEDNQIYQFLNKEKLDFNINLSKSQDMIHFPPFNLSDDSDNSDDDAHPSAKLGSLKRQKSNSDSDSGSDAADLTKP